MTLVPLLFHTSAGQILKLEITADLTVLQAKQALCSQTTNYTPDSCQLVYQDEVLNDAAKLAEVDPDAHTRTFILTHDKVSLDKYNFRGMIFKAYDRQLDPATTAGEVMQHFIEEHPEIDPSTVKFQLKNKSRFVDGEKERPIGDFGTKEFMIRALKFKNVQGKPVAPARRTPPKSTSGPQVAPIIEQGTKQDQQADTLAKTQSQAAQVLPQQQQQKEPAPPQKEPAPPQKEPAPPQKEPAPPQKEQTPPQKEQTQPQKEPAPPQKEPAPPSSSSVAAVISSPHQKEEVPTPQQQQAQNLFQPPPSNEQSHPIPTPPKSQPALQKPSSVDQAPAPPAPSSQHGAQKPNRQHANNNEFAEDEIHERCPIDSPTPLPEHNFRGFTPTERQLESIRTHLIDFPTTLPKFYRWLNEISPQDAQILRKKQRIINKLLRIEEPKNQRRNERPGQQQQQAEEIDEIIIDAPRPPIDVKVTPITPPSAYEERFQAFIDFMKSDQEGQQVFTRLHQKYYTLDPGDLFGVFISCDRDEKVVSTILDSL